MRSHLIQIDALDGAGDPFVLRLSSVDDVRACHLDGQQWTPAIARLPVRRYDFFGGDFRGAISAPTAGFVVATAGVAQFSDLRFAGARFRYWKGELGDPFSGYTLAFDGRIKLEPTVAEGLATFEAGPDDSWLDKPLLETFTGVGGIEGPDDLEGTVKPLVIGNCRFVPGVLIEPVDLVYRISCYGAIEAVVKVYDRVNSLGAGSGDFADLAALLAATIAPGSWASCKALGLVRLGAPPDGQVAFDVLGDVGGGNLLRWSEAFDNPAWGKFNLEPVAVDSVTAPDGTTTADKLIATTANLEHYAEQTIPVSSNQAYTQSIYVEPDAGIANISFGVIHVGDLSATLTRWRINNAGGTLSDGGTFGPLALSCSLIALSNGWWRISMRYTLSGTITSHRLRIYAIAGAAPHDTIEPGDGTSGIAVWRAQVRAGEVPGADSRTEGQPIALRLPGQVIGRLVELAGGEADLANLLALDAARPFDLTAFFNTQTTARQAIQEIADSVVAVAGISWTGKLFVKPLGIAAPSIEMDSAGTTLPPVAAVAVQPVAAPFWRLATRSEISWVVHNAADVATSFAYRGEFSALRVYRLDDLVVGPDGASWSYINATPGAGHPLPDWPAVGNAWWKNEGPPSDPVNLQLAIRTAAVRNPRNNANVARYMLTATTSGSTSTISVARHDWDYPNGTADITRALGNITGCLPGTEYWVYFDDATLADTTVTYDASMVANQAENSLANPERHPLGRIRTPGVGSSATAVGGLMPGGGTQAVGYEVGAVVTNFNTRNDRINTIPVAPTFAAVASTVEHTANLNASIDLSVDATYSGNVEEIDGFEWGLYASTVGTAYVPGSNPAAEDRAQTPPGVLSLYSRGLQPTLFYTWFARSFRDVDPDVAAAVAAVSPASVVGNRIVSAWAKPTLSGQNPYRPSTSTPFGGDVTGTVGGTSAAIVSAGSIAGNNAADGAGIIRSTRVRTGSVQNKALVAAGYSVQGSQIFYGPGATDDNAWGATVAVLGARAVVDLEWNWRFRITNPTLRQELYFDIQIILLRASDNAVIGNGMPQRISYIWQGAAATGTFLTERRTDHLQDTFDGLAPGNYNAGFRIVTPAGWQVAAEPYRYNKLNDLRATE